MKKTLYLMVYVFAETKNFIEAKEKKMIQNFCEH